MNIRVFVCLIFSILYILYFHTYQLWYIEVPLLLLSFIFIVKIGNNYSLEFIFKLILFVFFLLPCIGFSLIGQFKFNFILAVTNIISMTFFKLLLNQDKMRIKNYFNKESKFLIYKWLIFVFFSSIGGFLITKAGFLSLFSFIVPFSFSLYYFEQLVKKISKNHSFYLYSVYVFTILIYVFFFWSGFGRIIIATYLLIPFLIICEFHSINLNSWMFILVAFLSVIIGQLNRYNDFSKDLLYSGSFSHHLVITNEIIENFNKIPDFSIYPYIDQYFLLFFNWFPREIWASKPIGVGLSFVDDWIGRDGFGDGFSVSVGFLGESFYLLKEYWFIGLFISLLSLFIIRKILFQFSSFSVIPIIIFDVNLINYFWGGLATFGSRFWFMIFPVLFLIYINKIK